MPLLRNRQSGQTVDVPPEQVRDLLASGVYEPVDGSGVVVDTGQVKMNVPTSELVGPGMYAEEGVESSEERTQRHLDAYLEERYAAGFVNKAKAVGEGLASGLSLGLADPLMDDEATRAREEHAGGYRLGGEIVGAIAPSLFTGGAGGIKGIGSIGKALARTPAGLAARAERAISGLGAGAGLVGRTGFRALGGATEGALWSGGRYASDVMTGDVELSAEQLVQAVGEGALLGGAVGGGVSIADDIITKGLPAAKTRLLGEGNQVSARGRELIQKVDTPEQHAVLRQQVARQFGEELDGAANKTREMFDFNIENLRNRGDRLSLDSANRLEYVSTQLSSAQKNFHKQLGLVVDEGGIGRLTPEAADDVIGKFAAGDRKVLGALGDMRAALRRADSVAEEMTSQGLDKMGLSFSDDLRATLKKLESASEDVAAAKAAQTFGIKGLGKDDLLAVAGFMGFTNEDLPLVGDLMKMPGAEVLIAMAGARSLGRRAKGSQGIDVIKKLTGQDLGERVVQQIIGSQNRLVQRAGGLVTKVGEVGRKAGDLAMDVARPVGRTAKRAAVPGAMAALNSHVLFPRDEKDTKRGLKKMADNLDRMLSNPMAVKQSVRMKNPGLDEQVPGLSDAIARNLMARLGFLQKKMPRDPRPPSFLGSSWQPSDRDVTEMARYVAALDDPTSLIEDARRNRLTPEAVEAVREVYPSTYQEMKAQIVEAVTRKGDRLPYGMKVQLSILFDEPLDPTMTDGYLAAMYESNQRTAAPATPPSNRPGGSFGGGTVKIAEEYKTGIQRIGGK